jgi:uncharacterized damage-inducible protein DinB
MIDHRSDCRPTADEYAPFYETYVSKVGRGDIIKTLRADHVEMVRFLKTIPADRRHHRYESGKWSVQEVIGHVVDTETVFAYRALCFARGDTTPLPGMDQNFFVAGADFDRRSMASLIAQLDHLRQANILAFEDVDDAILDRAGEASGCRFTVRALLYILAGHARHHMGVLGERYVPDGGA